MPMKAARARRGGKLRRQRLKPAHIPDEEEATIANFAKQFQEWLGWRLARVLPSTTLNVLAQQTVSRDLRPVLEALGKVINRQRFLDNMPFDLACHDEVRFEHLAGLFASTSMDHGVIGMPIRQAAYLYGLVREMPVRSAIEIGRYKGGSTLVIAAAMGGKGRFWSIDIGEKEVRLHGGANARRLDEQLVDMCRRLGLTVELIVGSSRTVELETGDVDLVLIDGDHTYEGARVDFERFGRRVRIGGAVLFDDTFDEELIPTHSDTVGRLVSEITATGDYRLAKSVVRLAHLERVR